MEQSIKNLKQKKNLKKYLPEEHPKEVVLFLKQEPLDHRGKAISSPNRCVYEMSYRHLLPVKQCSRTTIMCVCVCIRNFTNLE